MAGQQLFKAPKPALHFDDTGLEQEEVAEIGGDALRDVSHPTRRGACEIVRHPFGGSETLDVPGVHELVARNVDDLFVPQ